MEGTYNPNFFRVNHIFMKYGGYWPPDKTTTFTYKIYKIYQAIVLQIGIVFGLYSTIKGIIEHVSDFTILIETLNVAFTIFLSVAKVVFWLKNAEAIKNVMNILEYNEFRYEKIDDFDQETVIKNAKRTGNAYTVLLFALAQLTLAFAYVPPCTLSFWYFLHDRPITNVSSFETLPYYTHIPFGHDTAIKYFWACILQCLPLHVLTMGFVGFDGIFMNLLNLIGENMIILQGAFRTLRRRCLTTIRGAALTEDGLYNSEELEGLMMSEMKKCVRHLQMLFGCCKRIDEIFKFTNLYQAASSLYILCSTLLLLSITPILGHQFGKYVFYLVGIFIQLGLYCWSGNELTLKTNDVSSGLWESDWLETRKPFRICMVLTMMRLQKPLYINAGKFVPLTLATEISVLKGSYSYFTVLKTMSAK